MDGVQELALLIPHKGPDEEFEDMALDLGDHLSQWGYRIDSNS